MNGTWEGLGQRLGSAAQRYDPPVVGKPFGDWCASRPNTIIWFELQTASHAEVVAPEGLRSGRPLPLARLEAVLMAAREPLGARRLAALAGLADGTEARTLVRTLNRLYDTEGRAFRVVEVAGGFLLMTRPKFAPWLRRLHGPQAEIRLSAPALETLAVIAYRQPVLRAEIEAIRGVQSGEVLRQLLERGLVRIVGRSEELGRPFLYGTTRQFLQVFGLRRLEELPRFDSLRASARAARPASTPPPDAHQKTNYRETEQPVHSFEQGDFNVRTALDWQVVDDDAPGALPTDLTQSNDPGPGRLGYAEPRAVEEDDEDFEDEDFEDEDLDEDDEDFEEDEDFEDDEDLDDEDWEEVDDEDLEDEEEEEDEEDEEDEEEEEEDEEDEDWDDEDWDDEDDDDWDEEEEEEEDEEWE